MGKVRHVVIGDESVEKEQKKKADIRREQKKAKKHAEEPQEVKAETADDAQPQVEQKEEIKQKKVAEVVVHQKSKKYLESAKLVEKNRVYSIKEAAELVKKTSFTKFDGTVEIHVNLNASVLGAAKTDFRGSVNLPHGTGKEIRIAIADDDVLKDLEAGKINFDVLIAHPSMMSKLAKFARTLGPKGLMPNPKNGTISPDPDKRAKELAGGQVNFKTEPENPIIHMAIGKVSFDASQIKENVEALFLAIGKNKILRATLTSTMGPGIKVSVN